MKEGELRGFLNILFRFFSGDGGRSCKSSYIKSVEKLSRDAKKVLPSFSGSRSFLLRGHFLISDSASCFSPFCL